VIRDRIRAWLATLPAARSARMTHDLCERLGSRISELGTDQRNLRHELTRHGEHVTAIAFGERKDEPGSLLVIDSQTKRVHGRDTTALELGTNWPVRSFQVIALADVQRVQVVAVYRGPNVLGMDSPVVYGGEWLLGERVRVICQLREAGA
jgi:hypothetical protein